MMQVLGDNVPEVSTAPRCPRKTLDLAGVPNSGELSPSGQAHFRPPGPFLQSDIYPAANQVGYPLKPTASLEEGPTPAFAGTRPEDTSGLPLTLAPLCRSV